MLVGLLVAFAVATHLPLLRRVFDGAGDEIRGVLTGALVICALGVVDDVWGLDAVTKLAGQVLAAALMALQGVQLLWLPLAGTTVVLDSTSGTLITVLVVVVTVNAVNFVDGLDGLAAGVVGIGASAFFVFSYQLANLNGVTLATTGAFLSAALAGACAGFLPHNFHPARLFMGDSGSMLLGLVLSASALTLTTQFSGAELARGGAGSDVNPAAYFLPLLLPISILIVPIADLVLAVVRRGWAGRSPFSPDKQHLHHRLLEIGHSQRRAVLIMWLWAGLIAYGTVLASLYTGPVMWVSLGGAAGVTIALTFLVPVVQTPHLAHHED
jgi:UDP-GlcNAc:undecaprenyl-phosphate GlcNAc-1-phosphate transferase